MSITALPAGDGWTAIPVMYYVIGMAVAFVAGRMYEKMRRAWADYRGAKAAVPGARRNAWQSIPRAARAAAVVVAVGVALAYAAFHLGPTPEPAAPARMPSAPPSASPTP